MLIYEQWIILEGCCVGWDESEAYKWICAYIYMVEHLYPILYTSVHVVCG